MAVSKVSDLMALADMEPSELLFVTDDDSYDNVVLNPGPKGQVLLNLPGRKKAISLEDYIAEQALQAIRNLVGPRLLGVLADWLEDDGRVAQADQVRTLASKPEEVKA